MANIEDPDISHVQQKVSELLPVLVKDLEDCCGSDSLSLNALQIKIQFIPSNSVKDSSFLHQACSNKNVTLEIIEFLLDAYPAAANMHGLVPNESGFTWAYPLHVACCNDCCPSSVIKLLFKKNPAPIRCPIAVSRGIFNEEGSAYLPLHCYLRRKSNIDIEVVKMMVAAYPDALIILNDKIDCTPLHIALHHSDVGDFYDVVRFIFESNPSSLQLHNFHGDSPLHIACSNETMNPKTIRLLLGVWPKSSRQRGHSFCLPVHLLCCNNGSDDDASLEILTLLVDSFPEAVQEVDGEGNLPVHLAARCKSWGFCKTLIDRYPESVRITRDNDGLPIHYACWSGTCETVKNLHELYPEGINVRQSGLQPIHVASLTDMGSDRIKIIEFLLKVDPGSASRVVSGGRTGYEGWLPLHIKACSSQTNGSGSAKLLFDAYPDAIYKEDQNGNTPVDLATSQGNNTILITFLQAQLVHAMNARDKQFMTTPDGNGKLPLHHALIDQECLGAIKLLVNGNPAALQVADNDGVFPLHIACQFGTLSVVQLLVGLYDSTLKVCDSKNEFSLHYACRGGNCDVVNYLLKNQMFSVSERNFNYKLPIHLLCETINGKVDHDSSECIETIWRLLVAFPETLLSTILKTDCHA